MHNNIMALVQESVHQCLQQDDKHNGDHVSYDTLIQYQIGDAYRKCIPQRTLLSIIKSHKSYAPTSKASLPTRSHATTRYKGKEIAKPITPPSESASEEDSDPEQAQRDKDMQKNLALIAKYFKKLYKPTNNNLRTSSNTRNKNVDTTPRIVAKCKQAEKGVQLQASNLTGLSDTDEEFEMNRVGNHIQLHGKDPGETSRTLRESNSIRDSCLVALQNKQTEFERYKAFNDHTVDYDKLERVAHRTNVSRPQPRSNQIKDEVLPNTSQAKFKKTEVEDHPRISRISNQTKSITTCNDSLNSRTSNVNVVCATCGKRVFNSNHDACVSKFLNDVNARTKMPNVVPISTRKPKSQANKFVATPHKKIVASESTTTNSKSYYMMLYKRTSKAWKWWIAQQCPSAYTCVSKTKRKWVPKVRNEGVPKTVSFAIDNVSRITNVLKLTNTLGSNLSCLPSSSNSLADCTVRFGNDQFAPILGYGDLVQGNITINRVYYVEGLNHNLFSVGQFCDADLEVAFRKSTCFVRDLQGNDLLTGNRGTDLYTISL
ncbi:hypothetical protein Tco_1067813 [Tanacetum coccineum]|uniref:Integrase, catalytic region, zinc finger, CCHC-type, peptidase aspartic, catalytic n=1 Tax=Tanacetum coccineum TaxID=301880 RepID=A0ABQ5HFE4_9ASTR